MSFRAAPINGALRRTPSRPVRAPLALAASGLLRVRLLPLMAVMTVSAARPVPATSWPTVKPVALVVGRTERPAATMPDTLLVAPAMTWVT